MSKEYIEREAALYVACDKNAAWDAYRKIKAIPAADVVEVRHGAWVLKERAHYFKCSLCKEPIAYRFGYGGNRYYNYCPNCGAKMDGGKKEDGIC